jgi:hypothetical protein
LPFGVVIALAINEKTALSKILNSKLLIFIGLVSYSIYLTHTPILHMVESIYHFTNLATNIISIVITFAITVLISALTYWLVERPYFIKSIHLEKPINAPINISSKRIAILLLTICVIYFLATFAAFQSDFNFFSIQYPSPASVVISPKINSSEAILMHNHPQIVMQINSRENNLGVITMNLSHERNTFGSDSLTQLLFRIKEKGSSVWYSTSGYDLFRIKDGTHYPFGFPTITNSKNKTYIVELYLSNPATSDHLILNVANGSIRTVYPVNKLQLVENPIRLLIFTQNKVVNVLDNSQAQYSLILFFPFLLFSGFFILSDLKRKRVDLC